MNRVMSVCKRYRRPLGIAFLALLCLAYWLVYGLRQCCLPKARARASS